LAKNLCLLSLSFESDFEGPVPVRVHTSHHTEESGPTAISPMIPTCEIGCFLINRARRDPEPSSLAGVNLVPWILGGTDFALIGLGVLIEKRYGKY